MVGLDSQKGPDNSRVHQSQLGNLGNLTGSATEGLNDETVLTNEGTSSSSLPFLQQKAGKETNPVEETTTQCGVNSFSGLLQRLGLESTVQSSGTGIDLDTDLPSSPLDGAMEDESQSLEFQNDAMSMEDVEFQSMFFKWLVEVSQRSYVLHFSTPDIIPDLRQPLLRHGNCMLKSDFFPFRCKPFDSLSKLVRFHSADKRPDLYELWS
ncbi:hypothetical protein V6N13_092164 [Hibiscus sabdariffa]